MHTQLRYDSMTWVAGDWPFRLCLLASVNDNDRTMKNKTKREAGAERLYGGAKSVKRIKEMKEYSGWG